MGGSLNKVYKMDKKNKDGAKRSVRRSVAEWVTVSVSVGAIVWLTVSPLNSFLKNDYNAAESAQYYNNEGPWAKEGYIAHGGGVGQYLYTNSQEAVYDSLQRGFQFIELDIIETDDGHLLAAHDRDYFCKLIGVPPGSPLNSEEVKKQKINGSFTVLLGEDIFRIMQEHPEMILVTDKITNYSLLRKEIPLPDRIIIECFSPRGIVEAKKCGFKHVAYSLFTVSQFRHAAHYGMRLLILPGTLALKNEQIHADIVKLHQSGVCMCVYGGICDDASVIYRHLGKSVSKFYMGKFAPHQLPPEEQPGIMNEK